MSMMPDGRTKKTLCNSMIFLSNSDVYESQGTSEWFDKK